MDCPAPRTRLVPLPLPGSDHPVWPRGSPAIHAFGAVQQLLADACSGMLPGSDASPAAEKMGMGLHYLGSCVHKETPALLFAGHDCLGGPLSSAAIRASSQQLSNGTFAKQAADFGVVIPEQSVSEGLTMNVSCRLSECILPACGVEG
jgi:hypothetical protein